MMLVGKFELLPLTFERLLHWEHHWELREPYGNFKNPTQLLFTQWDEQSTPPNIQFSCAYDHTPSIHSTSATWPALCYCIQGLPFLLLLFSIHPHNQQLKQRTLLLNCIQQLLAIWWGSCAHCNVEFRLVLEVAFDEETSRAEYVRKLRVKWYRQTESLWFENFLVLWANCSFHTQVQAASQHIFKLAVRLLVKIQLGKREACDEALIYSAL
jgi:hypothetical protein